MAGSHGYHSHTHSRELNINKLTNVFALAGFVRSWPACTTECGAVILFVGGKGRQGSFECSSVMFAVLRTGPILMVWTARWRIVAPAGRACDFDQSCWCSRGLSSEWISNYLSFRA